jgi:hypothetical protein
MTFVIIDIILSIVFILIISHLYHKEYGDILSGPLKWSLLSNYSIFFPIFKVSDGFLDFKTNIVSYGIIALLFKLLCMFFKVSFLKYILSFILLFLVFAYYNLYKQRKLIIQRDEQEHHKCECAYPVLTATKYLVVFKALIYVAFIFT